MKVTVKPYLFLRQYMNRAEVVLDLPSEATLGDLLRELRKKELLPNRIEFTSGNLVLFEDGQPADDLLIFIDGVAFKRMEGLFTVLQEGTVITLFPPVAGG